MPSTLTNHPFRRLRRRNLLCLLPATLACSQPAAAAPPLTPLGLMVLVAGSDVDALQVARLAALGRGVGLLPRRVAATHGPAALGRLQQTWQQLDRSGPAGPVVIVGQGDGARLATRLAADLDIGRRALLQWLLGAAGDAGFPRDDLARFEARCASSDQRAPALLMVDSAADARLGAAQRQALLMALPSATVIGIPGATQHDLLVERGYRDALQSLLRGWVQRRLTACAAGRACSGP